LPARAWRRAAIGALFALGLAACTQSNVATESEPSQPEPEAEAAAPPPETAAPSTVTTEPVEDQAVAALTPDTASLGVIAGRADALRVGLLVPLTGKHEAEGRGLLDAAQMALFDTGDDRFTLMPADSKGTAEGAQAAAAKLLNAGVQIVLGPMLGEETKAVAPIARARGVNLVSFSNNPNVAGEGVYLLGHMLAREINHLISYAYSRGYASFAVMAPADGYGRLANTLVRDAATNSGAALGPAVFYPPNAKAEELETIVLALANAGPFDALVLPDSGRRLQRILALLPAAGIDLSRVRLLGTGLWDDPRLLEDPALQSAWFVSPPSAGRAAFRKRFAKAYGYEPHRLAPLGYDATALAIALARQPSGADFSANALHDPRGFSGTEGIFRFAPDGTAERGLAVVEVGAGGTIKVVSPAPQRFPSSATAGEGEPPPSGQ
jgi:ABC-type branched-subunit amino acid transport system substrate-binding protein